jgi:hypothetical protein
VAIGKTELDLGRSRLRPVFRVAADSIPTQRDLASWGNWGKLAAAGAGLVESVRAVLTIWRSTLRSRIEQVDLETLDDLCASQKVTHIDYLKIDTEGGDFNVLSGATAMLAKQQIDTVEVEAGMNVGNKRHVPFEKLKAFFEDRNYFLFGIYEQVNEWPAKQPQLRRTNPVFISEKLIKANISN